MDMLQFNSCSPIVYLEEPDTAGVSLTLSPTAAFRHVSPSPAQARPRTCAHVVPCWINRWVGHVKPMIRHSHGMRHNWEHGCESLIGR